MPLFSQAQPTKQNPAFEVFPVGIPGANTCHLLEYKKPITPDLVAGDQGVNCIEYDDGKAAVNNCALARLAADSPWNECKFMFIATEEGDQCATTKNWGLVMEITVQRGEESVAYMKPGSTVLGWQCS